MIIYHSILLVFVKKRLIANKSCMPFPTTIIDSLNVKLMLYLKRKKFVNFFMKHIQNVFKL